MKKRELAELVCVIAGIWTVVKSLLPLASTILYAADVRSGAVQVGDREAVFRLIVTSLAPISIVVIFGCFLIFRRKMVAGWITAGWDEGTVTLARTEDVMAGAIGILGIVVATWAIGQIGPFLEGESLSKVIRSLISRGEVDAIYLNEVDARAKSLNGFGVVLYLAIGILLIVRAKWFASWWVKKDKEEEAGDVGGGEKV